MRTTQTPVFKLLRTAFENLLSVERPVCTAQMRVKIGVQKSTFAKLHPIGAEMGAWAPKKLTVRTDQGEIWR